MFTMVFSGLVDYGEVVMILFHIFVYFSCVLLLQNGKKNPCCPCPHQGCLNDTDDYGLNACVAPKSVS